MLTPGERRLIEDANAQVEESARRFAELQFTSGIRPPLVIESSESSSELERFNFSLKGSDESMAEDNSSPPCPPCPPTTCEVTLSCDSVSANKYKCGYTEFPGYESDPPIYYLTQEDDDDVSLHHTETCTVGSESATQDLSSEFHRHVTGTIDPNSDCEESSTQICYGSSLYTGFAGETAQQCTVNADCSCSTSGPGCANVYGPCQTDFGCCNLHGTSSLVTTSNTKTSTLSENDPCTTGESSCDPPIQCSGTRVHSIVLSDEYPTSLLISNTESALPAYDGDFDDECRATRELSSDETTYSIQNFKPYFTLTGGVLASNATINYTEHFVADAGGESFTPASTIILAGNDSAVGPEVVHPTANGYIEITEISCEVE